MVSVTTVLRCAHTNGVFTLPDADTDTCTEIQK